MSENSCPICGKGHIKVIYFGLPVKLCEDEECSCMFGFWSHIAQYLPYNGWLMQYDGNYWIALYHWLKGSWCEDDDS